MAPSKKPFQTSIDRWEGEGGAIRSGPQTSSRKKRQRPVGKGGSHVSKRRLGADEKQKIAEDRRLKEIAAHPAKMISVHEDDTDESGAPIVTVQYIGESARARK